MQTKIGILTGGGDAPGLNAAIRAVARSALLAGDEVVGVRNGWAGMLGRGDIVALGRKDVAGILQLGGTILGTSSRISPLEGTDRGAEVMRTAGRAKLDAVVAIGGDGTLQIAAHMVELGLPVVGVPKTIDNDLSITEYCIGFDTAVSRVAESLDRLHSTASAHHRVMVVEVMGRDTGWLAVMGGMAGGADLIVIPEVPTSLDEVVEHLDARQAAGSDFSLVVVSEGAFIEGLAGREQVLPPDAGGHARMSLRGIGESLAEAVEARTGHETRATVLGHTQRGGSPTSFDRIWATRMGLAAYRMAAEGSFGCMPVVLGGRVDAAPIREVGRKRKVPREVYDQARVFF